MEFEQARMQILKSLQERQQHSELGIGDLALKLRDVRTEAIHEDDATYAIMCSALGVYSVARTVKEAKGNFKQALDLHLSVLRERATKEIATIIAH